MSPEQIAGSSQRRRSQRRLVARRRRSTSCSAAARRTAARARRPSSATCSTARRFPSRRIALTRRRRSSPWSSDACTHDPAARFASMRELAGALEAARSRRARRQHASRPSGDVARLERGSGDDGGHTSRRVPHRPSPDVVFARGLIDERAGGRRARGARAFRDPHLARGARGPRGRRGCRGGDGNPPRRRRDRRERRQHARARGGSRPRHPDEDAPITSGPLPQPRRPAERSLQSRWSRRGAGPSTR